MAPLRIELLGGFELRLASGAPVVLPTRKSRLLLAYLALGPGRAQPRAKLTGLLWSDRAEPQARASLRQELHALRRALIEVDPPPLKIMGDAVAVDAAAAAVDAVEFERLARRGEREALARAAELYRGDLLEGAVAADTAFEEWLALERRRFRDLAVATLSKLLALEGEQGGFKAAVAAAQRLLALDPACEEAHRALMRLLARQGQRNAVLRQYQLCRAAIARELGVEPEEETEQLYRELLLRQSPKKAADQLPTAAVPSRKPGGDLVQRAGLARDAVEAPSTGGMEIGPTQAASGGSAVPQTEQRQLMVMSCGLADATRPASHLGLEDLHQVELLRKHEIRGEGAASGSDLQRAHSQDVAFETECIAGFLKSLGLARYLPAFRANHIDEALLPTLTDHDLHAIGVEAVGHRKRLLQAIAGLAAGGEAVTERPQSQRAPAGRSAERRQLTVMFVDMVGSTTLATRLDPEELREVLRAYQDAVAREVARFEGQVTKLMGDGVLAYFGWPQAHEDDTERAVRAGLATVAAVSRLQVPPAETLTCRVGIATGLVVAGDLMGESDGRQEAMMVGKTPNLAARLQALAGPGEVIISEPTRRLLGGRFALKALPVAMLKGFSEPVMAFQVTSVSSTESRFDAVHEGALAPLMGREQELALLLDRWSLAKAGEGQVVLISGEPGIGKSRLLHALRERLRDEPHTRVACHCSPYHINTAFFPILDQLARAVGLDHEDEPAARLDKLEALVRRSVGELAETVPLLAALLNIPLGERYRPIELPPERFKPRALEILLEHIADQADEGEPALVFLEDAQWLDPSSRELLDLFVERIQRLRMLLVATFRPELSPPWTGFPHVTLLTLNRLGRVQASGIVAGVAGGRVLPTEVLDRVLAKAEGVPLFIEELTKAVLEGGYLREEGGHWVLDGPLPSMVVPATLHDSLMARLDRLGSAKEVAQLAAVIGREFPHELLVRVADRGEGELADALRQLIAAELVFRCGTPSRAAYVFKHALVRDAAYASLLKSQRRLLHARVAEVLEASFPQAGEVEPAVLAHHHAEAGHAQPAIAYWALASRRSLDRSATVEAANQLAQGFALLQALPEEIDRQKAELELQLLRADLMRSAKHLQSEELEISYRRAQELCYRIGELQLLVRVLYGQFVINFNRPKFAEAKVFAKELLDLAERHTGTAAAALGYHACGMLSFVAGDLALARSWLERALAAPNRAQHRADFVRTQYPCVTLNYLSWTLFALGYPDQADARAKEALAEARRSSALTMALALDNRLCFDQLRRDGRAIEEHADALCRVAEETENAFFMERANLFRGWLLVSQGRCGDGIALLKRAAEATWKAGSEIEAPLQLALLADAYHMAGEVDAGLRCIDDALARVQRTGERWYEADLHRLKGDLIADQTSSAEACYRRALQIARGRSARAWELRAATSLARLWQAQDKHAEALALLGPICAWFTEDFTMPDLQDAKALLDKLSHLASASINF